MSSDDTPQDSPAEQPDTPAVSELADDELLKSQAAEDSAKPSQPNEEKMAFAEQVVSNADTGASNPKTTAINTQIAQAVEQICRDSAGRAGGIAAAGLAQVTAQSAALAMLNAVQAQQNAYIAANAMVLVTVTAITASVDQARRKPLSEEST